MTDQETREMLQEQSDATECSGNCESCLVSGSYFQAECRVFAAFADLDYQLDIIARADERAEELAYTEGRLS